MKIPPPLYVVTGLWHGKKREALSLPCSRLKALELRDWTRRTFQDIKVYVDIQIREIRVFYTLPGSHYICKKDLNEL